MPEDTQERIILHDIEGIAQKSGIDEQENHWVQFEVDSLAEQFPGTCSICGESIGREGWICLDGGEEVCSDHVEYADNVTYCSQCGDPVNPGETTCSWGHAQEVLA